MDSNKKSFIRCICILTPIFVWTHPINFLYAQNIKEVNFSETRNAYITIVICAIVFWLLGIGLFKDCIIAGLYSSIMGIVLGNFNYLLNFIQSILPDLRYWHILTFFILLITYVVATMSREKSFSTNLLKILFLVFTLLFCINFIPAIPTAINKIVISKQTYEENEKPQNIPSQEKGKNIYYLLCDEYASFQQLEKEYNYKNTDLVNALTELGFNISHNSWNKSNATKQVITNIMLLDYVVDENTTDIEIEKYLKNSTVKTILLNNGYCIRGIGLTDSVFGVEGTQNLVKEATTSEGDNFTHIALKTSFLFPFLYRDYSAEAAIILNTLETINQIEIIPDSSTFTFFYVCAPHHPYYFTKNGDLNPVSKYYNHDGTNDKSYIGEIEFLNHKLIPALERIVRLDPDAIIVLCSDHGNRMGVDDISMSYKILNAVYYSGETLPDIDGKSGIDTLIYIFNNVFDLKMNYRG